jgi:hypothetical protein
MIIHKLYVYPVYNNGTTVWYLGGKGKENERLSTLSKYITSIQVEDVTIYIESY